MIQLVQIPPGDTGTSQTLYYMADLVHQSLSSTDVADQAAELARHPGHGIRELRRWLHASIRYVPDADISRALGLGELREWLTSPARMVLEIRGHGSAPGDCDDVAMLAAALGIMMGYRARFRALSFGGPADPFLHVYTELDGPAGWEAIDTTRELDQRFFGDATPSRHMVLDI